MPDIKNLKAHEYPRFQRKEKIAPPVVAADYVELQTTTNFSFLRGGSHPEEYAKEAVRLGYRAIAVTDLHSVSGIVRAHVAAKEAGIPLITGARIALYRQIPERAPEGEELPPEAIGETAVDHLLPFSLCLYPTDRAAYGRLCRLLTQGKLRAPKGECYLTLDDLAAFQTGLLATAQIHQWNSPFVELLLDELKQYFDDDRLSLSIWNTYGPDQHSRFHTLTTLSTKFSIPLLATNDAYYHAPERRVVQDILTCIRLGTTIHEAGLSLFANAERFLKSPLEMSRLFRRFPEAIRRTRELAERIHFSLDEVRYEYPREIYPDKKTPLEYLTELTWRGAAEHYAGKVPEKVREKILQELDLIRELQYEKYFLTVYDIVRFAREQGILCQGRGAAANSAVCYVLGVTSVDPDRINLLFERFISKERNEPPDIDIDFEHERREEVIQYVYNRYGRHRAALVAEVITYRTRSALRDTGKAFGLSLDAVESLIKLVTRSEGREIGEEELVKAGLPREETLLKTLEVAFTLIGFPRHLSQHVGGMIISETPLSEIVPIEPAAMPDRTIVEWDKDDVDAMGMLKIDILALGMLTCIRKAFAFVNEGLPAEKKLSKNLLMLHTIPAEDPEVYDMLCAADTIGVFQIESRAQMSMLPRLKPRCFYDLVIEVAIVRPGPIQGGMVHPYLRRRSGKEPVTYPDARIEKILSTTLGVPIFQEQAMELVVVAAGFTPGEADALRRSMASWKRNKSLKHFEEKIVAGMTRNGYSREFTEQLFQQIQGFGEYGFPQSHAASFALLVYVSAWLKKHHPAAFAAGLMNSQPMGFYQPAQIVQDAVRHGVFVRPIDVNESDWDCTLEARDKKEECDKNVAPTIEIPESRGDAPSLVGATFLSHSSGSPSPALRLGFRIIKSLRETEAKQLRAAVLKHGKLSSLSRLWKESGVRIKTLRTLARADAFRSLNLTRQEALWELRKFRDEPLPLFDRINERRAAAALPVPAPQKEVLHDYRHTGLSLKAHPFVFLRPGLEEDGVIPAEALKSEKATPRGRRVKIGGLVLVRQRPGTASGMVFMTLEDETGISNLVIKPDIFRKHRGVLCDTVMLMVEGKVQREESVVHVVVENAWTLDESLSEMPAISRDFH